MPLTRRLRVALLSACVLVPTVLTVGPASAATVALGSRTFDAACNAAAAGDVITVPAGSYGSQTITCTKAVTFLGQGNPTVAYVAFSNANGPTVQGMVVSGGLESKASKNVTVRSVTIHNQTYVEGSSGVLFDHDTWAPAAGGTTWGNGDMLDIYEQTGKAVNTNITVQDSLFHGLRSPSTTAHPDAIQFCNCGADGVHAVGVKILRNTFYDNECMNVRPAPHVDLTLENNSFGDTVQGISGCGFYSIDVGFADVKARYNTFTGTQQIQNTPTVSGLKQSWVGNVGVGFSSGCTDGGLIGGSLSHNVWTGQTCGGTDKRATSLKLGSDGMPMAGSPVIDAGDMSSYPQTDLDGDARFAGAGPDAGAMESGSTTAPPSDPTPPADTTAPSTTITSVPGDSTSTSASLSFTSSESGSTFECKLDSGSWAACTSPKSYSGLAVGAHTFSVRATDAAGNTDASVDSASWTVNAPAPTQPDPPTQPTQPTPPVDPTPPATTPAVGLVAAYAFSETSGTTVKDSSGHGLDGVRSGARSTPNGKFGRGLSFDGDKDQVTIPDSDMLDLSKGMTLEAWVNPATTSGWRTVMAKEQSNGLIYGLYSSSDNGKASADVFTTSELDTRGSILPVGKWSHLAATYNGSTLTIYVNGVAVSTRSVSGSLKSSTGVLRLGGTAAWGEWFKGKMDEVRIYDKANTAAQIKADMKITNS